MPSPKRWCPVSRDINEDGEVWELTDEFGDRSFRTLIEVIAILDRVDNYWRLTGHWLASLSRKTRQKPASIQRQLGWMVARGWLVVSETLADGSPAVYSLRNYTKYHRSKEPKGNNLVPVSGSRSDPSLPFPIRTEPSSSDKSAVNTVDSRDEGNGRAGSRGDDFESIGGIQDRILRHAGLT